MNFDMNNVDVERQKTLKFAEDNNISTDEVDTIFDKIYNELPDELSDKAKELRALRKTRGSLRRIANSNANYVDGFVFMRFRDVNYNEYAWKLVDEYVDTHGEQEAMSKGMINEKGEYLHTSYTTQFSNQFGKVIDKKDARGNAIGIIKDDNGIDARFLSIGKFNVWDNMPLCREISLNIKEGTSPGKLFTDKNQVFVNGVRYSNISYYYSNEDFQSYADMIEEVCGDIFFSLKSDIDDYAHANSNNSFNFLAAICSVNRIGDMLDTGMVPIELELEDELITAWVEKNIFKDLTIEEGIAGFAFLNTFVKQDDTVAYRIGGFLPLADE